MARGRAGRARAAGGIRPGVKPRLPFVASDGREPDAVLAAMGESWAPARRGFWLVWGERISRRLFTLIARTGAVSRSQKTQELRRRSHPQHLALAIRGEPWKNQVIPKNILTKCQVGIQIKK